MKKAKKEVNKWLKYSLYGLVALFIGLDILYADIQITYILGYFLAFYFAQRCSEYAIEMENNPTKAYFLGFIFGLISLFVYYMMVKNWRKKHGKKNNK